MGASPHLSLLFVELLSGRGFPLGEALPLVAVQKLTKFLIAVAILTHHQGLKVAEEHHAPADDEGLHNHSIKGAGSHVGNARTHKVLASAVAGSPGKNALLARAHGP